MSYFARIKLWDGTTEAEVDAVTGSLRIIDTEHAEVHEGEHYVVADHDADVDTAAPKYWRITAPDTAARIHFGFRINASEGVLVEVFENPTLDAAGTALTAYNNNRNSSNTTTATFFYDTTVTSDGTRIFVDRAGVGGAGPSGAPGGISRSEEFILKQNEDYTIKVTPGADNTAVSVVMEFYEE